MCMLHGDLFIGMYECVFIDITIDCVFADIIL